MTASYSINNKHPSSKHTWRSTICQPGRAALGPASAQWACALVALAPPDALPAGTQSCRRFASFLPAHGMDIQLATGWHSQWLPTVCTGRRQRVAAGAAGGDQRAPVLSVAAGMVAAWWLQEGKVRSRDAQPWRECNDVCIAGHQRSTVREAATAGALMHAAAALLIASRQAAGGMHALTATCLSVARSRIGAAWEAVKSPAGRARQAQGLQGRVGGEVREGPRQLQAGGLAGKRAASTSLASSFGSTHLRHLQQGLAGACGRVRHLHQQGRLRLGDSHGFRSLRRSRRRVWDWTRLVPRAQEACTSRRAKLGSLPHAPAQPAQIARWHGSMQCRRVVG